MITCQICGKQMKWIQNTHLRQHNITLDEYRVKYPGSPTKTQEMHDELVRTRKRVHRTPIKLCIREGCGIPVRNWRNNKYCSNRCNAIDNPKVGIHHRGFSEQGALNQSYTNGHYSHGKKQKQLAYEYDKGCCVKCKKEVDGIKNKYGVHHLIPRRTFVDPNDADILENLVTLCSKCHKDVETAIVDHLLHLYRNRRLLGDLGLMHYLRSKIQDCDRG